MGPFEKAEMVLALEPEIAAEAKEKQREGGREKVVQTSAQAGKTRDELANLAGVSHDTIAKVKVIAAGLPRCPAGRMTPAPGRR
jgi:hypothetical protein